MNMKLSFALGMITLFSLAGGGWVRGGISGGEGARPSSFVSKGSGGAGNGLTGGVEKGIVSADRNGNGAGNGIVGGGSGGHGRANRVLASGGVERGFAAGGVEVNFADGSDEEGL